MRKLKFRGWNKQDKVMVYDLNSPKLFNGELIGEGYELMQFVGIKDKREIDIYEGDILKLPYSPVPFLVDSIPYLFFNLIKSFKKDFSFDVEIIGNIYENSELLDKRTDL